MLHIRNLLLTTLLLFMPMGHAAEPDPNSRIIIHHTDMDFETLKDSVSAAIIGQGLPASGTLYLSEMLQRTASDLGYDKAVYARAESLEFCSAAMAHRMMRANPANLVACPFTIGIYSLADDPDRAYVAYRLPLLMGQSASEAEEALRNLFAEIIDEAIGL